MTRHWGGAPASGVALAVTLTVAAALWPRAAGVLALLVLPGGWLTFTRCGAGYSWRERVALGCALSPPVAVLQFYVFRIAGLGFDRTVAALLLLNAPVIVMAVRSVPPFRLPPVRAHAAALAILLVPLAALGPQLLDAQSRAYAGHAWWHADAVYSIARGQIAVEDPDMAGVRLGYAWAGHAYQAALSWVAGATPLAGYIWTNVFVLVLTLGLAVAVSRRVGAGPVSSLCTVAMLSFGVNIVGYSIDHTLSLPMIAGLLGGAAPAFQRLFRFGGDWRFTPWLLYFNFFHQIVFALSMLAAAAYLVVARPAANRRSADVILLTVLASGIGAIYPVLYPAAAALIASAVAASLVIDRSARTGRVPEMLVALMVSGAVTALAVSFTARDRVADAMALHGLSTLLRSAVVGVVALWPLLAGLAWRARRADPLEREHVIALGLAGLACLGAYVALSIPSGPLEYKFIFAAAVFLAPFPAAALEPVARRLGPWAPAGAVLLTVVLAVPVVHKYVRDDLTRHWIPAVGSERRLPRLDLSGFVVRLGVDEPEGPLTDALREGTPREAIVIMRAPRNHIPTLAQRPLYVAPTQVDREYPGINLPMDQVLVMLRGYDPRMIERRRQVVDRLLVNGHSPGERAAALAEVLQLKRPVAVVLERTGQQEAADWFERQQGRVVFRDDRHTIRLIEPKS